MEAGGVFVLGEPLAELSDVRGGAARLGVGGDAFNTAVYLRRAGVPVQMLTALGTDPMSASVEAVMHDEGIGTDHLCRSPDRPVGLYAIETDEAGERSFTYWRGESAYRAWFDLPGCDAALDRAAGAELLYLSGISLSAFGNAGRERIVALARQVRANGGQVAFDTNYRPKGWPSEHAARGAIRMLTPHVSIALPTFEDEAVLFGHEGPEEALNAWMAAGASEACVKCGPDGALTSAHGWVRPPVIRAPLDTTGAGDSFNGAYLAARLRGEPPDRAAAAGNALAGEVIMVRGALTPRTIAAPAA